jgi:hypothetical protein
MKNNNNIKKRAEKFSFLDYFFEFSFIFLNNLFLIICSFFVLHRLLIYCINIRNLHKLSAHISNGERKERKLIIKHFVFVCHILTLSAYMSLESLFFKKLL